LQYNLEDKDSPKCWIVGQGLEDIHFIWIYDSAIDLVEQIHQDESVETDSV